MAAGEEQEENLNSHEQRTSDFQKLCDELELSDELADLAWKNYDSVCEQCALEGDQLTWMSSAIYVTMWKKASSVDSINDPNRSYVNLSKLIDLSGVSVLEFLEKLSRWTDMSPCPRRVTEQVSRMQSNFAVSAVIFKKYVPLFRRVFALEQESPAKRGAKRPSKSAQKSGPSAAVLFEFCWTLFIYSKKQFVSLNDDLMNCFHLLLCVVDLVHRNLTASGKTNALTSEFASVEKGADDSILSALCGAFEGVVLDAKHFRTHWWLPRLKRLMGKEGIIKGDADTLTGVLEHIDETSKRLVIGYEEEMLRRGEMDERVFIPEQASSLLGEEGTGDPLAGLKQSADANRRPLDTELLLRMSVQACLEKIGSYRMPTPLSGKSYIISGDQFCPVTPVSAATQNAARLSSMLAECEYDGPGEELDRIFSLCADNPKDWIAELVQEFNEYFSKRCAQEQAEKGPEFDASFNGFLEQRQSQIQTLFYRLLEGVVVAERDRARSVDFSNFTILKIYGCDASTSKLVVVEIKAITASFDEFASCLFYFATCGALQQDMFHRSIYGAALELVLFSYNSERAFPWVLDVLSLPAIHFYKIIELIIRSETDLSREMVKHMNGIEERVLEELAWSRNSPIWDLLSGTELVPSCQEVALPSQLDRATGIPSVLTAEGSRKFGSTLSPYSALGRYQSPVKVSALAKRKLEFEGSSGAGESSAPPVKISAIEVRTGTAQKVPGGVAVGTIRLPLKTGDQSMRGSDSPPLSDSSEQTTSKKRSSSLALFFRKVYYLASVRLFDICERLKMDEKAKQHVWTLFERLLRNNTDLMCGRHLDQNIMCCLYVTAKVLKHDVSFHEIMSQYRYQPQAASRIYRSVLLDGPTAMETDDSSRDSLDSGFGERSAANKLRSSSTLPDADANAQDEYGDLIGYYNKLFISRIGAFVKKFSPSGDPASKENVSVPLSPLPNVRSQVLSPRRSITDSVSVQPMQQGFPLSPSRPLRYSFNRSPYKDLKAINSMIRQGADYAPGKPMAFGLNTTGVYKRYIEFDQPQPSTSLSTGAISRFN